MRSADTYFRDISSSFLDNQQHTFAQLQQFQHLSQSVNICHTSNVTKSTTMQLPAFELQEYTNTQHGQQHDTLAPSIFGVVENNSITSSFPELPALPKDHNVSQTDFSPRSFRCPRARLTSWQRTVATPSLMWLPVAQLGKSWNPTIRSLAKSRAS